MKQTQIAIKIIEDGNDRASIAVPSCANTEEMRETLRLILYILGWHHETTKHILNDEEDEI